ncbi:MAG: helix-turn-helix transcriptional regulator [Firmicutes bacterium]|nr:helix-turn-helix transcriptional regulator [Bacillota bacterium]
MLHPEMYYFVQKECTTNWHLNDHKILAYSLLFVMEGSAHYIIDGKSYEPQKGNIIFIKPGSVRTAWTEGMRVTALDFVLPEGESLELDTMMYRSDLDAFLDIFRDIRPDWLLRRQGYELKCQALFALVLHKLMYEVDPGKRNQHVENMKSYILEHYKEEILVNHLAQLCNLNPVYCGALFKKEEGCTIAEFVNRLRMNKAADLLRKGEHTVGEVSESVGFKDIYYFSNTFKKYMGVSPIQYRNL